MGMIRIREKRKEIVSHDWKLRRDNVAKVENNVASYSVPRQREMGYYRTRTYALSALSWMLCLPLPLLRYRNLTESSTMWTRETTDSSADCYRGHHCMMGAIL